MQVAHGAHVLDARDAYAVIQSRGKKLVFFGMYKKILLWVGSVILFSIMVLSWYFFVYTKAKIAHVVARQETEAKALAQVQKVVSIGTYAIVQNESVVRWSLGKPLIPDYMTSGLFNIGEGSVVVGEGVASGTFAVNMDTLQIGRITEEGKEGLLQETLKGPIFFDVKKFPQARFVVTEIVPQADSATSFMYRMKGTLTMKGVTQEIVFPVKIYQQEEKLYADARFEMDRTLWGITASSSSFYTNLGNDAVSNTVSLVISIVAKKQ